VYDFTHLRCHLVEVCKNSSDLHGSGDLLCPAVATSTTFSISPKAFLSQKVESVQATVTPSKCLSLFEGFDGLDHLCGMDIGLHLGPNPFNHALWVDPERNSMNAIKRFAHELLGAPDTIGLHDFL